MEVFPCLNEEKQLPKKTLNLLELKQHQQKCNEVQWFVHQRPSSANDVIIITKTQQLYEKEKKSVFKYV